MSSEITAACQPAGGVVFDCDGVLADTTRCWDDALLGVAGEFDLTLSPGQLAELRGAALTTATGRLAQWSHQPLWPDEVREVLREQLVRAIGNSELTLAEGAQDLLDDLYGTVCLGVASNSPRAVLLHILARLEITEYFCVAISAEDVARPKPAPEPYLAACDALSVDPRLSFAIEDSEIGVRSAIAAGLTVIELSEPPSPGADQRGRRNTVLRVRSLADPRIRRLVFRSVAHGASPDGSPAPEAGDRKG